MTWINLGNPRPKQQPDRYDIFNWNVGERISLDIPHNQSSDSLASIIERRRTLRTFKEVQPDVLGALFWTITREQEIGSDFAGFNLSRRPVPSAGAVHPIHILISDRKNNRMLRYNPSFHTLESIAPLGSELLEQANEATNLQNGELIIFIAEPGKTQAIYHEAESLIWRDAGVLLGFFSLVAPIFNLNFCPLGLTGESFALSLDKQGRLHGVGVAILGSRTG